MTGRIRVVGLGPAGPELITAQTRAVLESGPVRLRTHRHPAAEELEGAPGFDHLYDRADTFAEVYSGIVAALVAESERVGDLVYAVPGSPMVLERTVQLLLLQEDVPVEVFPAMSFLDLAWTRLGLDPIESGVSLVDGHEFARSAAGESGPMLVAHCHNKRVMSEVKLAADEPDETEVVVMQRLGLSDEVITGVKWSDLDRSVEVDHLTTLFIPGMSAPVAGELVRLSELVRTLRRECPWDREQTHASLVPHLLEETYEVIEAIEALDPDVAPSFGHLEEELGDLLFQVVFHAALGEEEGWFTLADVARGIHDKLRTRHPHVFADVTVSDSGAVVANWEAIKRAEKGRDSVMDGVPTTLPAASLAAKVLKKAESVGWSFDTTVDGADPEGSLLAAVAAARAAGVDPEVALRRAAVRLAAEVRDAGY